MNIRKMLNDSNIGKLVNQSFLGKKFEALVNGVNSAFLEKPPWYVVVPVGPGVLTMTHDGPEIAYRGWGIAHNPNRYLVEGLPIPKKLLVIEYSLYAEVGIITSQ